MDPIKPDQRIRAGCAPPPFLAGARKKLGTKREKETYFQVYIQLLLYISVFLLVGN